MARSAPLGRLLIDTGVLTQVKLDEALVLQRSDRRRLGEILVDRGLVHPRQLAQLLSHQMKCPWISLTGLEIAPEVLALVSEDLALEHGVVPVHVRDVNGQAVLYVATDDPTDEDALADCAAAASMPVRPMVAVTGEVQEALARYYDGPPVTETTAPNATIPVPARSEVPASVHQVPTVRPTTPLDGEVEERDVIAMSDETRRAKRAPTVLVLNAPAAFLVQCREAVSALAARMVDGVIANAGELVAEHRPCAVVVTDDVYAFDRTGLNRLALDNDAHLVVWSEEVDGRHLEPLLSGAIDRWGRSSYEKGAIVDGRYELLRDLGGPGTSGSRWEVRNVRTLRRSLLALAVRGDEEMEAHARSVRCEQRALARISHPGAVELRDAGTTELGDPYVVLETLEGRTLDGLVAARTKLVVTDACAVALQVAETLGAAHAVGVVHGRVIPENIVVTRDGYGIERVKLIGWGEATLGDPNRVDVEGDLVGLGLCAFEAMTGRRPKPSEDVCTTTDLPAPVARLIARMLAKKADSAKELAGAITTIMPLAARPTALLEASPPPRDSAERMGGGGPPSSEQRRFARAAYRTPVRLDAPGQSSVEGRSEDISGGGLLVVGKPGLEKGTEISIRFALPLDGRVVVEAAVVNWSRPTRSDESSGLQAFGIELRSAGAETMRQITRYVSLVAE